MNTSLIKRDKWVMVVLIGISALFLLLLMKFSSPDSSNYPNEKLKETDLYQIIDRGYINVILGYNSVNYFIYKGTPLGFQYELVQRFAKELGIEAHITISNDLEKSFQCLAFDSCDIIAADLTIIPDRFPGIAFSLPFGKVRQVLVQRKPSNWRNMTAEQLSSLLIRDSDGLDGISICIPKQTVFKLQLEEISHRLGIQLNIVEVPGLGSEELIRLVKAGKIPFTVCDENLAFVNSQYYPDLDFGMAISPPQEVGWAVHRNARILLDTLNHWLSSFTKTREYQNLKIQYFYHSFMLRQDAEEKHSVAGGSLSPYDNWIKQYSKEIGYDWRLVASLIYQESRFTNDPVSYSGAIGIMQMMPVTAARFGVGPGSSIEQHIKAGCALIKYMDDTFLPFVPNAEERTRFVVAAYNLGESHVLDAIALTSKYQRNPGLWSDVEYFLILMSNPRYFNDPVVKYGYCNAAYARIFVREIFARYEEYCNVFEE